MPVKGKGKGPILDIALIHDEHNAQERFTMSEVADDWHELMIQQRIIRLSIWTRCAACRHTTAQSAITLCNLREG